MKPVGFMVDISRLNTKKGTQLGRGSFHSIIEFADSILPANHGTAIFELPESGMQSWFCPDESTGGMAGNPADLYLLAIPELKQDPALYQHLLQIFFQQQVTGHNKGRNEGLFQVISKWVLEECAALFFNDTGRAERRHSFEQFCEDCHWWLDAWAERALNDERSRGITNVGAQPDRINFFKYLQFLCFEQNCYTYRQLSAKGITRVVEMRLFPETGLESVFAIYREYSDAVYLGDRALEQLLNLPEEQLHEWFRLFESGAIRAGMSLWLSGQHRHSLKSILSDRLQVTWYNSIDSEMHLNRKGNYAGVIQYWCNQYNVPLSHHFLKGGYFALNRQFIEYCSSSIQSRFASDVLLVSPVLLRNLRPKVGNKGSRIFSEKKKPGLYHRVSSRWMHEGVQSYFSSEQTVASAKFNYHTPAILQGVAEQIHTLGAPTMNRDVCFLDSSGHWEVQSTKESGGFYELLIENLSESSQEIGIEMSQVLSGKHYGRLEFLELQSGNRASFSVRQLSQEGLIVRLKPQQVVHYLISEEIERT